MTNPAEIQFVETEFEPTRHYLTTASELQEAVDLIDAVRASMPADQQNFLLPRSLDYFRDSIAKGGAVLGLRAPNGQLIGTATLTRLNHWTDVKNFEAISFIDFLANEKSCLREGVCRHPDYKAMGVAKHIYRLAENWCAENDITRMIARVKSKNDTCLKATSRNGYKILSSGIDKKEGFSYNYIGKEIAPTPNYMTEEAFAGIEQNMADILYCI